MAASWTSPIIFSHQGRRQIVTAADRWVIAHDPTDGKELWRVECLDGDIGPSPVFAGGVVYVANEHGEFSGVIAIRADGGGDVTATHVLWKAEIGVPDTCSPLATAEFLFLMESGGTLTCYDAKKGGEPLWGTGFRFPVRVVARHGRRQAVRHKRAGPGLGRRAEPHRMQDDCHLGIARRLRSQPRVRRRPNISPRQETPVLHRTNQHRDTAVELEMALSAAYCPLPTAYCSRP